MSLLDASAIRASMTAGPGRRLALPGSLAALVRDDVESFPALRPHQRHAWHSFTVQLATLALLAAGRADLPEDEAGWAALLRGLTPGFPNDEPWSLVTPADKPALLQAPVPALADLKSFVPTPDALDMLVTSKNHDLKGEVMAEAEADDWLFALVTLQTMEGFLGAGNYGASRMNGGFANRAGIGVAPGESAGGEGTPGRHFRRDVERLVALRPQMAEKGYAASGGLGLVWLRPWDGTQSISPAELDPYYVEICRRVRLVEVGGTLQARAGNSKVPRIVQVDGGLTGDPWAPVVVEKEGQKVFTADAGGFGYRRVVELMFPGGRYTASPLQEPASTDAQSGLAVVFRALVRGQGKTEGYHERRVPLSRRVGGLLRSRDAEPLARAAQTRVKLSGEMQNRVLKAALLALFENGPDQIDFRDDGAERRTRAFLTRFDQHVDRGFFPALWREFEEGADPDVERKAWLHELLKQVRQLVDDADESASKAVKRRYRARARAEAVLAGAPCRNKDLGPYFAEPPK